MHAVAPVPARVPATGEVFLDARGGGRALRVTWHPEADVVVLSVWHGAECSGSFRLPAAQVPDLIDALREGLIRTHTRRPSSTG